MKIARRSLYLLAASLVLALSVTAVALAVAPGDWTDSKRKFTIAVANDGKHISGWVWQCKADRLVNRGYVNEDAPRIRRRGRFSFKGKANIVEDGQATGTRKFRIRGRFRKTRSGKWVARGTVKVRGCGKAKRFRAKPPAGAEG